MKKLLYLATILLSLSFVECTSDNDDNVYKYVKDDTLLVLSYKDYFFHPVAPAPSEKKGYVIVNRKGERNVVSDIEGFKDIYEEGYEYVIVVQVFRPQQLMPDLFGDCYKFVSLLERRKPHQPLDDAK